MLAAVTALDRVAAVPFVRVAANDSVLIAAALDAGAAGVVVPQVSSAEEATAAVARALYPPAGVRGAGPGRASAFGLEMDAYMATANARLVIAVQIETRAAVEQLDEILAVDGLTLIFVGPGDLAASTGLRGAELDNLISTIFARAAAVGVPTGIFAPTPERASLWLKLGARLVILGSDLSFLAVGARQALTKVAQQEDEVAAE